MTITTTEHTNVKKNKRSRNGCQQCRAIKKKCDEQKPTCSLCEKRGIHNCDYMMPLKLKSNMKLLKPSDEKKINKMKKPKEDALINASLELLCAENLSQDKFIDLKPVDDELLDYEDRYKTLVPILSQTKTFQTYLPFNISYKNQKILNFYETFTSSFLTPGFHEDKNKMSPFKRFIPKHAHTNKNLMRLILLFSKIHMKSLGIDYHLDEDKFVDLEDDDDLFDKTKTNRIGIKISNMDLSFLKHLANQASSEYDDISDYTLIQMVLISLHTFFPNISPVNWRQCIINAKNGALNTNSTNEMFGFLNHWMCYQELMSSLTTSDLKLLQNNYFDYDFDVDMTLDSDYHTFPSTPYFDFNAFDVSLLEIDQFSGMDRQTLKYLNQSVKLLQNFSNDSMRYSVQLSTMELITEMEKFLFISDFKRQSIVSDDFYLITTNKIFGKITLYMLKRRILEMNIKNNESIRFLLLEIIDLIDKIPLKTSYSSCVFFAMFISGCDLIIYDELISKRHIIINHLDSLHKNVGMESCQRVTNYMYHCWLTKKPWWEVFVENDIDIIFTI
ncbi:hypothetical protein DAHU10_019800 [Hanseniaspora uvarum]|nr:hypothetical protein DAHU10_019800 [Hanseniaspora uvarum]